MNSLGRHLTMRQERSRLETKFKEKFRNLDPKIAVLEHLKGMWKTQPVPNMDDMSTIGVVCSNIYSDDEDYLIVIENGYVLVGKHASVTYGEFDGYSSGNKSRKQIVDGLSRIGDYTIYRIYAQYEVEKTQVPILTVLKIDSTDIGTRTIYSDGIPFKINEIEISRDDNTFIVKELTLKKNRYYTPSGIIVEGIIPRKVNYSDESNSSSDILLSRETHEDPEREGQGSTEGSTE